MPKPGKSTTAVKPTTMRIPDAMLARGARVAQAQDRSRSWLFIKYIDEGLKRDEKALPRAPRAAGGTGAFS